MRVMVLVKATPESEAGQMPSTELLEAMGRYNEELTRVVRDVGLAEDLAQDALVAALEQWPESGVPENPGAWLMATAKHRAIDVLRRSARLERKHAALAREL